MSEDWGDVLDADRQALAAWAQSAVVPVEPGPAVRRRLLATLGGAERFRPFFEVLRRTFDLGAEALAELLRRVDAAGGWR